MATAAKLNNTLKAFIESQPLFFVATAAPEGRVNLSPKGLDSLRILSDTKIIWLNLSGSGNETASHLREHPRMTLMFCAFEGEARILRVYGNAKAIHPGEPDWAARLQHFPVMAGSRQVLELEIDLVQTSCGTGVPLMQFSAQRGPTELLPFYEDMGADGVRAYWDRKNSVSLDGKKTGI
ncbi:MAG: pyridoxamine 5'-phosphate oxidase family protein [Hyphomicrobiales bacterium]|nr:pyridoxamine 5'-phosphate oxidase family protein [Hyphomicrobiales bacterium]